MSKEEELYVRNTIQNTDHGLEKLFTSKFINFYKEFNFVSFR
jgi:hypothetical protein